VKRFTLIVTCVLSGLLPVSSLGAAEFDPPFRFKVLSFNIRYGTARDGEDAWPKRREMVSKVIQDQAADFVGVQEALRFQLDAIGEDVSGYGEIGVGRDDGKTAGEYSAILFKKDRWSASDSGTVWLSDTPDKPGSKSWGNSIPRVVTWGRFTEKSTGRTVMVFNTHFDHQSQPSREKSAEFIKSLIAKESQRNPFILMGDLNAGEDNPAILTLKSETEGLPRIVDTFRAVHPDEKTVGTFNGFSGKSDGAKIDYIFVSEPMITHAAEIVRTSFDSRYPSDHFPVSAEVELVIK